MQAPLLDTFGRVHNNLRISVTDRCNLRCTYCMPEEVTFLDKSELLTFEEIAQFVRVVAPAGVDKIRLTGGEPLMRRELPRLVRMLCAIPGIRDVGLTTNGLLLADQAQGLYDAGLRRINISLDTLDPARFRQLTRRDGLDKVIDGIHAAKRAGFDPVKINAVSIRGITEHEVVPLARFAREHGLEMRFIEYMPIGADQWERGKVFFAHEILELLERDVGHLVPVDDYDPRNPAMEFRYIEPLTPAPLPRGERAEQCSPRPLGERGRGEGDRLGIIASISRPFCQSCNRIRLTAEGKLRNCLFALDEVDLKPLLRSNAPPEQILEIVRGNVHAKWEGHEINTSRFIKPLRTMHAIGG